jgi:acyl-CoA synthetase (AMP-forming)/AMP-acid ligase II
MSKPRSRGAASLANGTSTESVDGRLRAKALAHPARPAVIDDAGTLTYGALNVVVDRLAAALQQRGIRPGQHVALLFGNARESVIAYFAAVRAGALPVPLDPDLPVHALPPVLARCEAATAIAAPGCPAAANSECTRLPAPRYLVATIQADSSQTPRWEPLVVGPEEPLAVHPDPAGAAALHYTSGTTSEPKGALYSHQAILAMADLKTTVYGLHGDSRLFCSPPLHYAAAWCSVIHVTLLAAGGTIVLTHDREPSWVADILAARRVTFVWTVPATYLRLLDLPDLAARDLTALEACLFTGMPMPPSGIERLRAALPHVRLMASYGQTETKGGTIIQGEELIARPGSVGRPLPGTQVRIVDQAGEESPPGSTGEIWLRGPGLMLGYYKDPETTAAAVDGGWYHTGDAGYLDVDGHLYVAGRVTEMINHGGHKINPTEVEATLLRHPGVREVAVLGLPDPYMGESVAAVVAPHPGQVLTVAALEAQCRALIAPHKVPARIAILPALPRNAAGKVQKDLLTATLLARTL